MNRRTVEQDRDDVLDQRDWLVNLISQAIGREITDTGFDYVTLAAELVYETERDLYEVRVRKL